MIIKILLAVVLALGVGNVGQFIWAKWQARGYQKQIEELQTKNLEQKLLIMAKDAALKDRQAESKVKERVIYVKESVDKAVESGDDAALRQLFIERGMLPKDQGDAATGGTRGHPGHKRP